MRKQDLSPTENIGLDILSFRVFAYKVMQIVPANDHLAHVLIVKLDETFHTASK